MLSQKERRYIQVCTLKAKDPGRTNQSISDELNISIATIERAYIWGRDKNIYKIEDREKLQREIGELEKIVNKLEKRYKALDRRCQEVEKEGRTAPIHFLTAIAKTLLDYRTRLAELHGIYRKTLNLNQSGEITVQFVDKFKNV